MSEYDYSPGTSHDYISSKAPRLSTRIEVDGADVYIQFESGRLVLDGPIAKAFDEMRAKQPALSQYVQRVNRERAIEMVRAHEAAQVHSIKGGIDSRAAMGMQPDVLVASGKRLAEMAPNNPTALKQFVEELTGADNIAITEQQSSPVSEAEMPVASPVLFGNLGSAS